MSKLASAVNKLTTTVIFVSFRLMVYALIVLLLVRGTFMAYHFGYHIFYQEAGTGNGNVIPLVISETMSVYDISELLYEKALIDDKLIFVIQAGFFDYDLQSGSYQIEQGYNTREILKILAAGPESGKEQE